MQKSSKPTSCGVLVQVGNHYLVAHSTNCGFSYGIPKGLCNTGESKIDAALRELREETGITLQPQELISLSPWLEYSTPRKQICVFKAILDSKPAKLECTSRTKEGIPEFDQFLWVTLDEALQYVRNNHMKAIFNKEAQDANKS